MTAAASIPACSGTVCLFCEQQPWCLETRCLPEWCNSSPLCSIGSLCITCGKKQSFLDSAETNFKSYKSLSQRMPDCMCHLKGLHPLWPSSLVETGPARWLAGTRESRVVPSWRPTHQTGSRHRLAVVLLFCGSSANKLHSAYQR